MLTDLLRTPSIQRLSEILRVRYGKDLEVRHIVDASLDNWERPEPMISNGDLMIPIRTNSIFLGVARITSASGLSKESIAEISDLVNMVLEPVLYDRYLAAQISNLALSAELNYGLASKGSQGLGPELAGGPVQDGDVRGGETPDGSTANEEGMVQPPSTVLLFSSSSHRLDRMSLMLHEQTDHWAFLRYSDMNFSFGSVHDLRALGRLTLFVEDLLQISPDDWVILKDFLLGIGNSAQPMIILGSFQTPQELRASGKIDPEILDLVAPFTVDIDRWPVQSKMQAEAFRMLFSPPRTSTSKS
ncbi:MAG: hypothetical protein C5B49_06170 [Bdellovibrio sp.]|nr:MAG: hypothetical protein C5B49_06170 [Bdellovibrio sp.]